MTNKKSSYTKEHTHTTLHNLIMYLFYILFITTPLIYFRDTNESFEFPKMTFVYLVVALITLLFGIKRVLENNFKFQKAKAGIGVLLLLMANIISTLFSINKYTSTWGYYTRFNGGLVSIAIFTLMYFIYVNEVTVEEKELTLNLVLITTIPVCIYAIAQSFGFEKDLWKRTDSEARVFSTLGQPNWLAAYLVVTIFPALKKSLTHKYLWLFFVIAVLNYAALWFTYSLSGLLGLACGILIFLLFLQKNMLKRKVKVLGLFFCACLVISILKPGVIKPKLHDAIQDIKRRISQSFVVYAAEDTESKNAFGDTTAIRLIVWRGTRDLIFSSPKVMLIGTGPETFPYAFPKFRPSELNKVSEWDFIFNKPHNYYLELLSNLGLAGLVSYLLLITKAVVNLKQSQKVALCAGLIGLFVTDFFGWHTVTTSMLLYLYIALME